MLLFLRRFVDLDGIPVHPGVSPKMQALSFDFGIKPAVGGTHPLVRIRDSFLA